MEVTTNKVAMQITKELFEIADSVTVDEAAKGLLDTILEKAKENICDPTLPALIKAYCTLYRMDELKKKLAYWSKLEMV